MSWILWALLGAVATAGTAVLTKVGMEKVDSTLALAIQSVVILILTWCVVGYSGQATRLLDIEARSWPFLVAAGVMTTVAYLCYFRALSMGDSSRVAPVDRLSLVFALVFGAWFLREKLTPATIIGGMMMAVGALVIAVAPSGK